MIGEYLRARAATNPDDPAIVARGRRAASYADLLKQVTRTVDTLNRAGYGRGDRIALALPSGPETTVALLGVVSGCICVPLNPASSPFELRTLLSRCRVDALITLIDFFKRVVEVASEFRIPVIGLEPEPAEAAGCFRLQVEMRGKCSQGGFSQAHEQAVLFPTSGTTGLPKLIPLTQAEVHCHGQCARRYLRLTSADRCLDFLPPFHYEPLNASILSTIFAGGSGIYPNAMSPRHFLEWLQELRPTWCAAPPPFYQSLISELQRDGRGERYLGLRTLFTCGAPFDEDAAAVLEQAFHAPFRNSYGATECGGISINPLPPATRKRRSVGISVGPEIGIVDELGEPVPTGQQGEVVVRGDGVFRGYEGDLHDNADTFFGEWYRTGDQGYLDDDGYLFLTGRIQEMINRGGQKIAPLEVDEVLRGHPDVAEAATFAVSHRGLGEDVAAAVVLRRPGVELNQILEFAAQRLSAFKVPRKLLVVPEIPKGPAGKIARNRLAVLFADELARSSTANDVSRNPQAPAQAAGNPRSEAK